MLSEYFVGALILEGTVIIGRNKKGIPKYRFKPIIGNGYFYVCSRTHEKTNQLAVIKYTETIRDVPHGTIIKIIGPVTNPDCYKEGLLWYNNLSTNQLKYNLQLPNILPEQGRIVVQDPVFSIDPPGCIDIDDAISYNFKTGLVGIHIADPSYYLDLDKELDAKVLKRVSSIYLGSKDLKDIHMLPLDLVKQCSLLPDKLRLAVSVWFNIGVPGSEKITLSIVSNGKAMTYDYANKLGSKTKIGKAYNELKKAMCIKDSHKLVELLMIKANTIVGTWISKKGFPLTRSHEEVKVKVKVKDADSDKLSKFLSNKSMKAANYVLAESTHFGLSTSNYTHFTSPIRRYADILVHRIVKECLKENIISCYPTQDIINDINIYQKKLRKFYFNLGIVDLWKKLFDISDRYVAGYFTKFDIETKMAYFFLEDYNIEYCSRIFNIKLDNIIKITNTDTFVILQKSETDILKLELFAKYDLILTPAKNAIKLSKKIKMSIIGFPEWLTSDC